jgi:hypothetical protein
MRAPIRLRELWMIIDERLLNFGHFLGQLFERAAFFRRGSVARCHGRASCVCVLDGRPAGTRVSV